MRQGESEKSSRYSVRSAEEASAFLSRATFGATEESIRELQRVGDYRQWIRREFKKKPSYHLEWVLNHAKGVDGTEDLKNDPEGWQRYSDALGTMQRDAWWDIVVRHADQLRQRVAFALSEILVVSRNGPLLNFPDARLSYYDILVRYAFDNFKTLLRAVTYHPAMGKYLSYLGNAKADPRSDRHPDENYAREVMQLFTIGLYQLNPDGSRKLHRGNPIPTYTQQDIREMARVFTGLSDDNGEFPAEAAFSDFHSRTSAMVPFDEYHDRGEKRILHGKKIIPAGGDTVTDINTALHHLFMHPNVGPFLARRLIQRLVTSNPSPGYIARVAGAFDDNGKGVRGDLKAVIEAILLDKEALRGRHDPKIFGKFREPLLYPAHLFRAFHAKNGIHTLRQGEERVYRYRSFNFNGTGMTRQEGPLEALTVFNYFTPDDGPYSLKKKGLVAPELELYDKQGIDDVIMGLVTENSYVYRLFHITARLQLQREIALIARKRYRRLIDRLDLILTGSRLDPRTKQAALHYIKRHIRDKRMTHEKMARLVIGLIMTSPDYAFQR